MSETDLSSSSTSPSAAAGQTSAPKVVLGTTIKLNGTNYLLWAQAFRIFIGAQSKLPHLLASPPPTTDPTYSSWLSSDYCVMTWLLNSTEPQISSSVMFLTTAKEMWDNLKIMYGNEKNASRVFEIYERLFTLKQGDRSVPEFFGELKGLIDELEMHQPAVADAATLLGYRRDLAVSKFLSGLHPNLQSQVRGQILGGDTIPSLTATFSRVMQVSTGVSSDTSAPSPPSVDQSAMFSSRGRGRGRGRGRDSLGGRGSFSGRQGDSDRGSRQCGHCGRTNHISEKCWEKFGRPQWAQVADAESTRSPISTTISSNPATTVPTVQISQADYDRLRQLELSQNSHSATHASSSGMDAYIASPHEPWVLDSGASSHMTGIKDRFVSLHLSDKFPSIRIADGTLSPVLGAGVVHPTSSLKLTDVLYAPKFPVSLLSISKFTKHNNCKVTFFPSYCVFQDLATGMTIGSGHERGGMYYLDDSVPGAGLVAAQPDSTLLWHWRLGHPSLQKLRSVVTIQSSLSSLGCESCELGKHHRASFQSRVDKRSSFAFELVHSDVWGPCRVPSVKGFRYFIVFVDDFSRMTWLYLLKERSEVSHVIELFYNEIKTQFSTSVHILRTDNALEYMKNDVSKFCALNGIIHQTSCSHTSQQNGVAERKHRHILDVARTLMIHMNIPKYLWSDAVLTACYLINRMPSSVLDGLIPFHCLYPAKKRFSVIPRVFGCTCFVQDLTAGLDKLSPRSIKCVFVGYSRTQKGYRCYHPTTRRYFVSADVTFFESVPYFSSGSTTSVSPQVPLPSTAPTTIPVSAPVATAPKPLLTYSRRPKVHTPVSAPADSSSPAAGPSHVEPHISSDLDVPIALRKGKRSCPKYPISLFVSYDRLTSSFRQFALSLSTISLPRSHEEALLVPAWKQAMDEEMNALLSRGTWDLVSLPAGATVVGCRWVYTLKYRPDGSVDRYKARLVAKGYTQTYGIDYFETFSPVARLNSIRILFSLAVNMDWAMHQLDVKNAFLYGDLDEEVYMEQPPGYVAQGENLICRLRKAIYGLKQSPRAWFDKFSKVISNVGFQRCQSDHSVFLRRTTTGLVILAVYVDDILLTVSDSVALAETKEYLNRHFVTKDMGKPKYFLGIEVAYKKHGLLLSQRKYVLDLLEETGLLECKPASTPMEANVDLWRDDTFLLDDAARYRRLIGKLIYLTVTRPDITFAVGVLSRFMHKPREVHWTAALKILAYVKSCPGKGLLYKKHGHTHISAFSDAGYAGDMGDRKSTSGFCTFVGGNLVTWRSKKQDVVSRSSAEAEYRAMAHTACEMVWLRKFMTELGFVQSGPMPMHCDNQSAIYIAQNPVFHERTKHIEIDCNFVRDAWEKKIVSLTFTPSSQQLADILTKATSSKVFSTICDKLGMVDIYAPA